MLTLSHHNHSIEIQSESIIIIKNAKEEDYWKLANEDLKVEFDGESLFIHSPSKYKHEKVFLNLITQFNHYFDLNQNLGKPIGSRFALLLPNGRRPEPDIVILPPIDIDPNTSVFEGIPLLVIEILSPTNLEHDLTVKKEWFTSAFIPEIWYISIDDKKITKLELIDNQYVETIVTSNHIRSKLFPNLAFDFETIFNLG